MAEIALAAGSNRLVLAGPVDFLQDISYAAMQAHADWMEYERPRPAFPFRPPPRGSIYQEYKALEVISNTEAHQSHFIPALPAHKSKNRYIDILPCKPHSDAHSAVRLPEGYINANYIAVDDR